MRIDTTCPHCSKPAKSVWSKINDTGFRVTACSECGKPIQLNIGPLYFICAIFWIAPALLLPTFWLRLAAVAFLFTALTLFRALRYGYKAQLERITFGA
jgi:hypothetical protein